MHAHLVQIVVGLSLLQAEGLPQLGWEAGQQLIENVIISLIFGLQGRQGGRIKEWSPQSLSQAQLCTYKHVHTQGPAGWLASLG